MFGNLNQSWIPIFFFIFLSGVGLFISLCLILSLIPLYLNDHSVEQSNTIYPVYTINNLTFVIGYNASKQTRSIRSTLSSFAPTSTMITSVEEQLNYLFNKAGGHVVVSVLTIVSTTKLFVTLKIYFVPGCSACKSAQENFIKNIFKKSQTIQIYLQYYQNCSLYSIISGTTLITLDNDITNNEISSPVETLISSLVQQTDLCGINATLTYPTGCIQVEPSSIVTAMAVNSTDNYTYYCYYFVPSISASNINVQFTFSNVYASGAIYLDDVTLNSTVNLITNGDFEIVDANNEAPLPPWTSSTCGTNCLGIVTTQDPRTGEYSFGTTGTVVTLSQTVPINTVGQQYVYQLGFWIRCYMTSATTPYIFFVRLTTT